MKPSVKRMISSLAAIVFLGGALTVFFNFVKPLYTEIREQRAEAAGREATLAAQKNVVAQVKELIASYEEGARLQEIVSSALPLQPNVAEAVVQLHGIAQANGLTSRAFSVASVKDAKPAARADILRGASLVKPMNAAAVRVELAGSYGDFRNFLSDLATNIRIFDVRSFGILPLGKPGQDSYTFTLTVAAYYQES